MNNDNYDICIIGGGTAGLAATGAAVAANAKVALIEKSSLGGDASRYGCGLPSKMLLHMAKIAHSMCDAARFGFPAVSPEIQLERVMQGVRETIHTVEPAVSPERFRDLGVDVIFGEGRFTDPRTFTVGERKITARKFVLATGSKPSIPPIAGIDQVPYLTDETVFSLQEDVVKLVILGAGPIGCEIAQAFARLGTEVDLIDIENQILPREDFDMVQAVEKSLLRDGVRLYLGYRTLRVEGGAGEIIVSLTGQEGLPARIRGSHLFVATGRRPNRENLGLEAAGVRSANGHLIIDKRLRTTNKNIYACGDVAGPHRCPHPFERHARAVLGSLFFHLPGKSETTIIPWRTLTDPEIARVGLSETDARKLGKDHRIYRLPITDAHSAVAGGEAAGTAKIIATPGGRLLGAALTGRHAGESIHAYVLALSKGMNVSDLCRIMHVHPTSAQISRRLADRHAQAARTPLRTKWIRRLFSLRGDMA